jgi:DNA modification methylase
LITRELFFNWPLAVDNTFGCAKGTPWNTNVHEYNKVTRFFKYHGETANEILNPAQKSLALCEDLVDIYGKGAAWGLDLCAGSGTFMMAGLRAGLNMIAVDDNQRQVLGMAKRVSACLKENVDQECGYERTKLQNLLYRLLMFHHLFEQMFELSPLSQPMTQPKALEQTDS